MEAVDNWHKTKPGHLVFGLVELLIAYGFGSLALNSAHLWEYVLAFVFIYGGARNLIRVFKVNKNGKRKH